MKCKKCLLLLGIGLAFFAGFVLHQQFGQLDLAGSLAHGGSQAEILVGALRIPRDAVAACVGDA